MVVLIFSALPDIPVFPDVVVEFVAVEGETADVAFLILFGLFKALFELALFLETVFLGHLLFLFVSLHDTTVVTEIFQFSVEHLVSAEFTFQTAVIEGDLDTGFQADLLKALFAVGENPGIITFELMFQAFTNHLISTQKVGRGDTLTIRGIGNHDALIAWLGEVLEVLLSDGDVVGQTCGLHVEEGRIDGFDVNVVTVYMVLELTLLALVVIDFIEQVCIEVRPFLKGIFFAEQTRGHVLGDEGCLDENGTGAAHGIDEIGVALPTREQDHACSEHLIERCLDTLLTITASVQRLTAGVKAQGALVFGDVHVQTEIGVRHRDVRPFARLLTELVDNGILHLIGDKLRVSELLGEYH